MFEITDTKLADSIQISRGKARPGKVVVAFNTHGEDAAMVIKNYDSVKLRGKYFFRTRAELGGMFNIISAPHRRSRIRFHILEHITSGRKVVWDDAQLQYMKKQGMVKVE